MHLLSTDTIIAPATPQGYSAIAVIRLSGPDSIKITNEIFKGADLSRVPSHTVHYGWITDRHGEEIDEVMVTVFRAPRSFTTEDSTEISCHGSPALVQSILNEAVHRGAKVAQPGEFTMRAFMHGRLDLSQAEAVADLIQASSSESAKIALHQLKGHFSGMLKNLRQQLIDFAALMELELDFSEEDVEFANRQQLKQLIHTLRDTIRPLAESFHWGNSIRSGIPVTIAGPPNAGKSTLLNTILREEKALVSDIAGTTRDFIEDSLTIEGIQFRFIDTAGIRQTEDLLEGLGIERSLQKMAEADIIILLMDIQSEVQDTEFWLHNFNLSKTQKCILLLNKSDAVSREQEKQTVEAISKISQYPVFAISAKDYSSLNPLFDFLKRYIQENHKEESTIITNVRHYEALRETDKALRKLEENMKTGIPTDLLAMDIREALHHLGSITGEIVTDDLLESIFSRFCIGK